MTSKGPFQPKTFYDSILWVCNLWQTLRTRTSFQAFTPYN